MRIKKQTESADCKVSGPRETVKPFGRAGLGADREESPCAHEVRGLGPFRNSFDRGDVCVA